MRQWEKNTAIRSRSDYGKPIKIFLVFSLFILSVNSQVCLQWKVYVYIHTAIFSFLNWIFKTEIISFQTTVSNLNPFYIKMYDTRQFMFIRDALAAVNRKWTVVCFICRTYY